MIVSNEKFKFIGRAGLYGGLRRGAVPRRVHLVLQELVYRYTSLMSMWKLISHRNNIVIT